jgi:hypothetical protein
MTYFDRAITPNEVFVVRYHIFPVPTSIDLSTWRLHVTGLVDKPLALSKVAFERYFLASRRRGFVQTGVVKTKRRRTWPRAGFIDGIC